MGSEQIVGTVIMCIVSFGCSILFYGIGIWAQQKKDPMHFYSGTNIDPRTLSDIPAYNKDNAKMWKTYALPYFLTGLLEIAGIFDERLSIAAAILLVFAGTAGIVWLIWQYKLICSRYMNAQP